jgi:hypothetical protein
MKERSWVGFLRVTPDFFLLYIRFQIAMFEWNGGTAIII